MKKQLCTIAITALCMTFVITASELQQKKEKKSPAEIMQEYQDMAQEIYNNNQTNGKKEQNKQILKNRQEWEEREKHWQENGLKIKENSSGKHKKLTMEIEQQKITVEEAKKQVDVYNSWSPTILWQYCFSPKKYKRMKSQAEETQEYEQGKLLDLQIKREYNHEKQFIKNYYDILNPLTLSIDNANTELNTRLKEELKSFKQKKSLPLFVKSSFLKKEEKELLHRYQQSKE